jgi:hypothetical protein
LPFTGSLLPIALVLLCTLLGAAGLYLRRSV